MEKLDVSIAIILTTGSFLIFLLAAMAYLSLSEILRKTKLNALILRGVQKLSRALDLARRSMRSKPIAMGKVD